MVQKRKGFSLEDKLSLIKEHLIDKTPVSELCERLKIRPSAYYAWQKALLERGSLEVNGKNERATDDGSLRKAQKRIAALEEKLLHKDSVLAQVMEDYVQLKKSSTGES